MGVSLTTVRPFLYLLVWAMSIGSAAAIVTDQFERWYPQFGGSFERIKRENCWIEYQRYHTGNRSLMAPDELNGASESTILTQPLIDCLLEKTSEFIKGNMTGAQVLLGVMPTVLSLLGASIDELAMVITVARRPILGLLLAFGSPSAYFSRAFAHDDVSEVLKRRKDRFRPPRPDKTFSKVAISALQYIVVFALGANVLHCAWEIGIRAVSSIVSDSAFLPPLWVGLGVFVQLTGACVFRIHAQGWRYLEDARFESLVKEDPRTFGWFTLVAWAKDVPQRIWGLKDTEFIPASSKKWEVRIVTYPESRAFLFAAWLQSTLAVLHVVFGTLVFSSMIFIGTLDALGVVSRFFVSTMICRIIVRYELAGIKESWVSIKSMDEEGMMEEIGRSPSRAGSIMPTPKRSKSFF